MKDDKIPLISVIVPVYNTEKYLSKCLNSLINQTFNDIEIIVVNDASPGSCDQIINEYVKKYSNVKLIKNERNAGLYSSRLIGVKEASGKYIMHLDSDDYLIDNSLFELSKVVKEDDYDIIAFNYIIQEENGNFFEAPPQNKIIKDEVIYDRYKMYDELFCGMLSESNATKIFKKELYFRLFYDINLNITFQEDYLSMTQLIYYCKSIRTIKDNYYVYFQRQNSSTKFANLNYASRKKTLEDLIYVNNNVVIFFQSKNLYGRYKNSIGVRENLYYNWIYNDIVTNLNNQEKKEIDNLILNAFPILNKYIKILERIKESKEYRNDYYISVIIPVFNTEKYLSRCLDSIINQSFKDLEIVLVNDHSLGNCDEIAEKYKLNNENIVYIKNELNMGSAWSRLNGLSYARGRYVHFVDSDDWLFEESYKKIHYYLGENYDVLHFDGVYSNDEKSWKIEFQIPEDRELVGERTAFKDMFINDSRKRTLWSRVYDRKCVIEGAKHMPKDHVSIADDWILNLFSLYFVKKYRSVREPLYYYYQDNPTAMTSIVENKAKTSMSIDKMSNILRQDYISYNAVVTFLKEIGVWEKYRALWALYITRDLNYTFIRMFEQYEDYMINLVNLDKEKYIFESLKLFKGDSKTSNLLKFIEYHLYQSNYGNIYKLCESIKNNSFFDKDYNVLHRLLSVKIENNKVIIYFLFFKITFKKRK